MLDSAWASLWRWRIERESHEAILYPHPRVQPNTKRKKSVFEVAGRGCGPEVARGHNIRFAALVSSVPETESIECRTGKLETGRKSIVAPVKIADVILLRRNFEFGVAYSSIEKDWHG